MAVLKYYNTSTSTWQAVDVGAQGPQGVQGAQGYQGGTITPASSTATSAVTATAGQVQVCNPSTTFAVTLPASPANGTIVGVYVLASATSYVTVAAGAGNTLDYTVGRLYAGQNVFLVYDSVTSSWIAQSGNPLQATPAGYNSSLSSQTFTTSQATVAWGAPSYLYGGMTFSSNGFVVPVTGLYQVNASILTTGLGTAGTVNLNIFVAGVQQWMGQEATGTGSSYYGGIANGHVYASAGNSVTLKMATPSNAPNYAGFFSIALVSQ